MIRLNNIFYIITILFYLLIIKTPKMNAIFIKLYDNFHFYELFVENNNEIKTEQDKFQSFSYNVLGSGKCSEIKDVTPSIEYDTQYKYEQKFNFNAETLIYSNFENTLSFLLQFNFKPLKQNFDISIIGYELVFSFTDNDTKHCVQILSNKDMKELDSIKFSIKDPSFLSQNNLEYIFYFGKVLVRALIECDRTNTIQHKNLKLCSTNFISSNRIPIGIKSEFKFDTSHFEPDICEGHLMKQTCIQKYNPKLTNDEKPTDYFIIMHPMPQDFEKLKSDIDIFHLEEDKQLALLEAKKNGQQTVKFGDSEISMNNFTPKSLVLAENLISYRRQKLPNNLVIKFIEYDKAVSYVGVLAEPTESNVCKNNSQKAYCRCKNECRKCYKIQNEESLVNYVPLGYDPETNIIRKKSRFCKLEFYSAYNFDSVKMVLNFQNQKIKSNKYSINNINIKNTISNRNHMPRFCFKKQSGDFYGFYNIKIILNDYHFVAQTSLINETKYTIKVYEFYTKASVTNMNYNPNMIKYFDTRLIAEKEFINSNYMIEINNMLPGYYLFELIPKQSSKYCPLADECIDESFENNRIQCIKCNRLITKFYLEHTVKQNEKLFSQLSKDECAKIKLKISIHQNIEIKNDELISCSKESLEFRKIIDSLLQRKPYETQAVNINDSVMPKTVIHSTLIPNDFNINRLRLAFESTQTQDYCNGYSLAEFLTNKYAITMSVILLLVFISFVLFYFFNLRDIPIFLFANNDKLVVFYLSIFLNQQNQQTLKIFIEKYIKVLKNRFRNMSIEIIDYTTEIDKRANLIENAQLIIYVNGTRDEITENLKNPIRIGTNLHHDEYNKIHFLEAYLLKSIDITFNKDIQCLDRSENKTEDEISSLIESSNNQNNCSKQAVIDMCASSSSSTQSKLSSDSNKTYFYLKLPEQQKELISILMSKNKNDIMKAKFGAYSNINYSYSSVKNSLYSLAFLFYMRIFRNSLNELIKREYKKNPRIFLIENNINYDDQPHIADSEFIEYDIFDTITKTSSSSEISSSSIDSSKSSLNDIEMNKNPIIEYNIEEMTEINYLLNQTKK